MYFEHFVFQLVKDKPLVVFMKGEPTAPMVGKICNYNYLFSFVLYSVVSVDWWSRSWTCTVSSHHTDGNTMQWCVLQVQKTMNFTMYLKTLISKKA